ncbi:MAG: hypothetical protein WAN65_09190 [Candidatus Sulfotelmatobacter sp.]
MKEVAILLLVAIMLNGCGSSRPTAQSVTGGVWSASLSGGEGSASGFSFITQFTVDSSGTLSFSRFQFINQGNCFPLDGGAVSGSMGLTENMATDQVTGSMTLTVASNGNTLTLSSPDGVTGTLTGTTLSNGSVTGTWAVTGGTGCTGGGGSFTMTSETTTKA